MGRRKRSEAVEYTVDGTQWRVELFTQLQIKLGLNPYELCEFHGAASEFAYQWGIVRALYGIRPTIPPPDTDPDTLRPLSLGEVCGKFDTDRKGIEDALETMGSAWAMHLGKTTAPTASPPKPPPQSTPTAPADSTPPDPEVVNSGLPSDPRTEEECMQVLANYGFAPESFDLPDRTPAVRLAEVKGLAATLTALRKLFEEPTAAGLARRAIVNEVLLRRMDDQMLRAMPNHPQFQELVEAKRNIEQAYGRQWEQLEALCPWIRAVTTKITLLGCLSDILKGVMEYYARGNSEIIDGLYTDMGVQVEMRASEQVPEPRYRPGWVLACLEAKQGLFDPKWKRQLPQSLFRILDDGLREAHAKLVDKGLIKLPNLEGEGPASEYPPLEEPASPCEEDTQLPDNIQLDDAPIIHEPDRD